MFPNQKLDIVETIKEGINIGFTNLAPILVNVVLWVLTCWIPYLNVGTTIGLFVGIVSKASRGETISSTEIFDPKYRKYMGEFFLTFGMMIVGIYAGFIFGIIPGIIISYAWSLALLLLIDKGKNPTEALTLSNNFTYGYKWRMFAIYLLLGITFAILATLFALIPYLCYVLIFALIVVLLGVQIGVQASIYRQLTEEEHVPVIEVSPETTVTT
ncbi:MAG: hypothetical protein FWG98_13655 [Candidatus Cloacimonetes bacterium]|nr:hypothetical protein [Candidatus Cloacimonadota bacterium]